MGETEAGLLPGERLVWTGRPARARVMPEDLVLPGLLLAGLLVWVTGYGAAFSANDSGGLALVTLGAAAELAALTAAAVWALRVKPDKLRRTVYQVTDRRVMITTGPRYSWAAFLDQIAEPVLVPHRNGTADLSLREDQKFRLSLSEKVSRWAPYSTRELTRWALNPVAGQPFPVLRDLPDAELARQAISAGRARMLGGMLDVPPTPAPPGSALSAGSALPARFVPAPGEQIVWTGRPQTVPWWFGPADIGVCVYSVVPLAFFGFAVSWALSNGVLSNGTPPPWFYGFPAFMLALVSYPAFARVLRRHFRIKRSVYIVTSWRLITAWGRDSRTAGTQSPLARLLPPQVKNGTVFMNLAWPPPVTRRDSLAQLMWPSASTDPPQLIGLPDPRAVADLICAAQLAERARTWQLRNSRVHGSE